MHMAAEFDVAEWLAANRDAHVTMTQPKEVTWWTKTSKNEGGQFMFGDLSGLPTYHKPKLPANLNEGFTTNYTAKEEGIASPVDTIIQAASAANTDWSSIGICTYRNNLNKILQTPQGLDAWELFCCYWAATGTLFLDIIPGAQASYPNADKFTYYGYHFEALCTGGGHVDATSEFASVVTYRLGQHQVLMAAEVDAQIDPDTQAGPSGRHYAELKTYTIPRHAKAVAELYGKKHPRWWVQSYLAGIPTLVLGGRDQTGTLHKVDEVSVQMLPGLSANAGQHWSPALLLACGDAILTYFKQQAMHHPNQQLHCSYDPTERTVQVQLEADGDMPARLQAILPSTT